MIQRIQTIFLLLAAGFFGGTALLPLMRSSEPIPTSRYFSDGVFQAGDHPLLFAVTALGAVLALVAVFLYRNRPLQIRRCSFFRTRRAVRNGGRSNTAWALTWPFRGWFPLCWPGISSAKTKSWCAPWTGSVEVGVNERAHCGKSAMGPYLQRTRKAYTLGFFLVE
jgi:hypothetical protein